MKKAIVLRTGDKTWYGRVSTTLCLGQKSRYRNFYDEIRHFSHSIACIIIFPGFLVLFMITLSKYPLEMIFKYIIGHSMGCIPFGIFPLLSLALKKTKRCLKRKGNIVLQHSYAFEPLSCVSALIIDKSQFLTFRDCQICHLYLDRKEINVRRGGAGQYSIAN